MMCGIFCFLWGEFQNITTSRFQAKNISDRWLVRQVMRLPARAVACSSSINSRRLRAKSTSRVDSSGKKKRKEKEAKERERKREKERLYKVGAGTGGSSVVDRHVTNFHLRFSFRQLPSKKSKQTICLFFFVTESQLWKSNESNSQQFQSIFQFPNPQKILPLPGGWLFIC
jgi:hypothetical protein